VVNAPAYKDIPDTIKKEAGKALDVGKPKPQGALATPAGTVK
jgi:hypothetical protein